MLYIPGGQNKQHDQIFHLLDTSQGRTDPGIFQLTHREHQTNNQCPKRKGEQDVFLPAEHQHSMFLYPSLQ